MPQEGVSMTEQASEQTQQKAQEAAPAAQEKPAEKPPWGEEFDAEKAWNLVQNLRADKERLSAREVLTDDAKTKLAEYDRLVEASKSDAERRDDEIKQLQESTAKIPTLEAENMRLKTALEKGLPADLASRLQGSTQEELAADADKLLALIPSGTETRMPKPTPGQGGSGSGATQVAQLSQAEVERLYAERKYDEIEKARAEGRLDHILGASS